MSTAAKLTVQAFYSALGNGDVAALRALFANEIAWTEAERFPYYGGTWKTFDEVAANLLAPLGRDWDRFAAQSDRLLAEGDDVIALGAYSGTHKLTGRLLGAPFAHHWKVADGKITTFTQYTDTAKVREAMQA